MMMPRRSSSGRIDLQPSWPYAWYGMGLAEYGVGDSQISFVTGLKTMLGKDALTRSAVAFAKSAEIDPSFVRGLVDLANTALRQRVNIKLGVALEALRRSAATPAGNDPQVLLARGRVEREVGDGDSALVAFNGYLQQRHQSGPGAARGGAHAAPAGPLRRASRRTSRAPWWTTPLTVAGYRSDLATIASDSVLGEFDSSRAPGEPAYLRRFWGQRDRTELRTDGERLREHYRRLFYARKNFQLTSNNRHYDIVERYRSGSRDFDDRGVIYIRHGEPSSRASYAAPGLEPNESWRYSRTDGDLIFHFIAREDVQDFKLVESLFDVLGFSNAVKLQGRGQRQRQRHGRTADAVAGAALAHLPPTPDRRPRQHRPLSEPGAAGRAGEHRGGNHQRQLRAAVPQRAQGHLGGARRGPGLDRASGADRLRDLGVQPRAGHRRPAASSTAFGCASWRSTETARSCPRSTPPGTSSLPSGCRPTSTWWAG